MPKVALVTGGTAGIGLATAKMLAADGLRVYVTGRSDANLDLAGEHGLIGVRCDMANLENIAELQALISANGDFLDVLVANAGTAGPTVLGETGEATFDQIFDLNVRGLFFTVQTMLPILSDGASIVLIGSIYSILGAPDYSVYSASKAAVRSFARSWANDLRSRRIRVNTVSPGPVITPLARHLAGNSDDVVAAMERSAAERTPAGRIGTPEDIASAVAYLCSPGGAYVNGIEMFVDGGRSQI